MLTPLRAPLFIRDIVVADEISVSELGTPAACEDHAPFIIAGNISFKPDEICFQVFKTVKHLEIGSEIDFVFLNGPCDSRPRPEALRCRTHWASFADHNVNVRIRSPRYLSTLVDPFEHVRVEIVRRLFSNQTQVRIVSRDLLFETETNPRDGLNSPFYQPVARC